MHYSYCIVYRYQTNLLFYFPFCLQQHLFHIQNKSIFFAFDIIILINAIVVYLYDTVSTCSEWTKIVLLEVIILLDIEYIFYLNYSLGIMKSIYESSCHLNNFFLIWSRVLDKLTWFYNK
jgi:uncharacterized membrane protein YobD (UPF0266 family)